VVADVFDEAGTYLGPVLIPSSLRWELPQAVVSKDWLVGTTLHEGGYPQVVRFRVRAGNSGSGPG
jgi:hypothetical protein